MYCKKYFVTHNIYFIGYIHILIFIRLHLSVHSGIFYILFETKMFFFPFNNFIFPLGTKKMIYSQSSFRSAIIKYIKLCWFSVKGFDRKCTESKWRNWFDVHTIFFRRMSLNDKLTFLGALAPLPLKPSRIRKNLLFFLLF